MKPHKWQKEIIAWANGAEIECKWVDGEWHPEKSPHWDSTYEYRIKPVTPVWYYMRDNHTFRRLQGDRNDVIITLFEEFADGHSYGSVFSKTKGYEDVGIHAHGKDTFFEFCQSVLLEVFDNTDVLT